MDRAIASDLSYLVIQKQRRELEGAHLSAQQPAQRAQAVTLSGTRAEIVSQLFSDPSGDRAHSNPPSRAIGEREGHR